MNWRKEERNPLRTHAYNPMSISSGGLLLSFTLVMNEIVYMHACMIFGDGKTVWYLMLSNFQTIRMNWFRARN